MLSDFLKTDKIAQNKQFPLLLQYIQIGSIFKYIQYLNIKDFPYFLTDYKICLFQIAEYQLSWKPSNTEIGFLLQDWLTFDSYTFYTF